MRLARPGIAIDKFSLATVASESQWYVEDPFDLKHNLAARCSDAGRRRILDEMQNAAKALMSGSWLQACPPGAPSAYLLKCRISNSVTPELLLESFREFDLRKLHFPSDWNGQAFLEFPSSMARRCAHTKNEIYIEDCQLHLHYSSIHGLADVVNFRQEMTSYAPDGSVCATFDVDASPVGQWQNVEYGNVVYGADTEWHGHLDVSWQSAGQVDANATWEAT
jgi:hypothetical protein